MRFAIYFILFFSSLQAQVKFSYDFQPMEVLDTIRDESRIQTLRKDGEFFTTDTFVKRGEYYSNAIVLFKKESNYWLALLIPAENQSEETDLYSIGNYLHCTTHFTHGTRGISGDYSYFYIIDTRNRTYAEILSQQNMQTWDTDIEDAEVTESSCSAKMTFDGDELLVITNQENNIDCIASGIYKIDGQKLTMIKRYDEKAKRMRPIRWVGKIATSMTLGDVSEIYFGDVEQRVVENRYGNCAEEDSAIELWYQEELVAFVVTDGENAIRQIVVTDSKHSIGKINTGMSAKEILKIYPKAKPYIGSLDNVEHIFIDDLDIDIVFTTDDHNRIGKYRDEEFVKLTRDRKVDYMVVNRPN